MTITDDTTIGQLALVKGIRGIAWHMSGRELDGSWAVTLCHPDEGLFVETGPTETAALNSAVLAFDLHMIKRFGGRPTDAGN